MSGTGKRHVIGGNGRNPSGRKVLIFIVYVRFLARRELSDHSRDTVKSSLIQDIKIKSLLPFIS